MSNKGYDELVQKRDEIDKEIKKARTARKREALNEIKKIIKHVDLTYEEVVKILPKPKSS